MLNLKGLKNIFHNMALKNLCLINILLSYFSSLGNLKALIQIRLTEYYITWLRSSAISLDGYGSKIQNVSRCRPTVWNETILPTNQKLFFTKVSNNWHCTIGFLINTAPKNVYFILQYHLFFRKKFFL